MNANLFQILEIALTFFITANPIGNSPAIIALIKEFEFEKQKSIMLRESLFALFLAFFFQYAGNMFLKQLEISLDTLKISGGLILLFVALEMIFTALNEQKPISIKRREPYFVPIATPLLSGPALLTFIMVTAKQVQNHMMISVALLITWIGVTAALLAAPYLNKILKRRGLAALSQLMGLCLTMIAVGMLEQGIKDFIEHTQSREQVRSDQ